MIISGCMSTASSVVIFSHSSWLHMTLLKSSPCCFKTLLLSRWLWLLGLTETDAKMPFRFKFEQQLVTVRISPSVSVKGPAPTRWRQIPSSPTPQPSSTTDRPMKWSSVGWVCDYKDFVVPAHNSCIFVYLWRCWGCWAQTLTGGILPPTGGNR